MQSRLEAFLCLEVLYIGTLEVNRKVSRPQESEART